MNYSVIIKPGHPTSMRRRNGLVFTSVPVEIADITDAIRTDPWLQIVEHPELQPAEPEAAEPVADSDDPAPRRGRKK